MKETTFQTEILNSLKEEIHPHFEKIPDMPKFSLRSMFSAKQWVFVPDWIKGMLSKPIYRFSPPRPYDSYFVWKGKFYALELKQHKKKQALPFSCVSDHQVERLKDVVNNGDGHAYILINIRIPRECNDAYAFPIQLWEKLRKDFKIFYNRKSIPVSAIREKGIKLPWRKKGRWDITPII
jgi:recombination protein U